MDNNLVWLKKNPIAHRGLHEPESGHPENSLAAFRRAVEKGYAIELDVQIIRDHTAVVFHDEDLNRMCGLDLLVSHLQKDQLPRTRLGLSEEAIPTLRNVLDLVVGRVPLLIEVKHWVKVNAGLHAVLNPLLPYIGKWPLAIQSFNPRILGWFFKNAPLVPRGQLVSDFKAEPVNPILKYLLREGKLNFISKPHFLSCELGGLSRNWIARKRGSGMPVLGWTATSPKMGEQALTKCDNVIFEGYLP